MQQNLDPAAQAEKQWQQWQEAVRDRGIVAGLDGSFVDALKQVWEASDYVAQSCLRDPELLTQLIQSGVLARGYTDGEMAERLREHLEGVSDEVSLHRQLRRFRRQQMEIVQLRHHATQCCVIQVFGL